MNKILASLRDDGIITTSASNMSTKIKNHTIKFDEVQHILDRLGYKLQIVEK